MHKLIYARGEADSNLKIFNGVRVLSITYVILVHAYYYGGICPQASIVGPPLFMKTWFASVGNGAFFAVDAFFFLSAFMGGYILLTKMVPKRGRINYPLLVFHRYYRLIFPIICVTLFISTLFRYFGSGPVWAEMTHRQEARCEKYWWTNLLMVMNLNPWVFVDECVGWTWYIGIDFQLFLITPLLVFFYCKRRWLGYTSAILLILASSAFNYAITVKKHLTFSPMMAIVNGDMEPAYGYMDDIYSKPWGRMQSYFVGFIFSMLYFEYKQT